MFIILLSFSILKLIKFRNSSDANLYAVSYFIFIYFSIDLLNYLLQSDHLILLLIQSIKVII